MNENHSLTKSAEVTGNSNEPANDSADVAIIGGGLAGLTLAIHLRQRQPDLRVHVIERRRHPVVEGAFKVGESTVEIGAHYLADVLGLRAHLEEQHLRKFGFRFFFSDGRSDIDRCTEIGVSRVLPTPSWQVDRGRLENFLGVHARLLGVRFDCAAVVRRIALSDDDMGVQPHRITYDIDGAEPRTLAVRWLVDASGRAGLLKKKLELSVANDHHANAVWWRVEGRIDPDDWSQDAEWLARCDPPDRWRSTNHLCGPGYWVWLIPLASGAHSLGIVCDAAMHPLERMNTFDKALDWLRQHQPRIAQVLTDGDHALQDFAFLRNYSYDCAQVFSDQRWAITGEAGCFLDPFYSPGTDFIAIANTYIVDLIERDRQKKPFAARAQMYQQLFSSFYENTLSLYQGQYALFGDAHVMPLKVIWDYSYYWALLAPICFAERLTDVAMFSRLKERFATARALNVQMQAMFTDWSRQRVLPPEGSQPKLLDQCRIDWFHAMNQALADLRKGDEIDALIIHNVARLTALADELQQAAARDLALAAATPPVHEPAVDETAALLTAEWYGEPA